MLMLSATVTKAAGSSLPAEPHGGMAGLAETSTWAATAAASGIPAVGSRVFETLDLGLMWAPCCDEPTPASYPDEEEKLLDKRLAASAALRNISVGDTLSWEWNAAALGVRKLPSPLGWVGVVPSVAAGWLRAYTGLGAIGDSPDPSAAPLWGQQGGWMATRGQIRRFQHYCRGAFLPPRGAEEVDVWLPRYNVEFWSGGFQLFSWRHCGVGRIIRFETPYAFASHLVLHATGNKQRQKPHEMHRAASALEALHRAATHANASLAATSTLAPASEPRHRRRRTQEPRAKHEAIQR